VSLGGLTFGIFAFFALPPIGTGVVVVVVVVVVSAGMTIFP